MNLHNQFLDEWFVSYNQVDNDFRAFPFNYNYPVKYNELSNKLTAWVHPFVNNGSMLADNGFLTDHGPEHIKTVIKRATQLIVEMLPKERLTPYEVYILLMAIQVHDVGNIISRNGHEDNSAPIVEKLIDPLTPWDRIEWLAIFDIARSHGGEDKDKISKLPEKNPIHGFEVRSQLLAAILKFADELAEDSSRAARYLLDHQQLPELSVIFHEYALSLHSVLIKAKDRVISMHFTINEDLLHITFKKEIKFGPTKEKRIIDQHLIDEIYLRTLKTHYERLYCMRFLRPYINIDKIVVSINVNLNDIRKKFPEQNYLLIETGINDIHMDQIFEICPELKEWTGVAYSEKLKPLQ